MTCLEDSDMLGGDGALVFGAGNLQHRLFRVEQALDDGQGSMAVHVFLVHHKTAKLGRTPRPWLIW